MKNTELRIGNMANVNSIESIVYDVMCDGVSTKDFHCMEYENVHGIPLNEEWLIKLGFEKCNDMDSWYKLRLLNDWSFIEVNPKHNLVNISINGHNCPCSRKVKAQLHTLQNLYFALTGEELTIKE